MNENDLEVLTIMADPNFSGFNIDDLEDEELYYIVNKLYEFELVDYIKDLAGEIVAVASTEGLRAVNLKQGQ